MHVWVIQQGEPLPIDAGAPRLLRSGMLADALVEQGHRVTWWATTFNHATKTQRAASTQRVRVKEGYEIILVPTPGYSRNISLRRLWDHRVLGKRFAQLVREETLPDIIHCAFPTIELAYEAVRYAKEHSTPCVIDARDMWPDIFVDALPRSLRPIGRTLLRSDFEMTRFAFRNATAITGHAPGFVEWGLQRAGRERTVSDVDFPFSYPATTPTEHGQAEALEYWRGLGVGVRPDEFVGCFLGTFAERPEVDLQTIPAAARLLSGASSEFKFVLCGSGPGLATLREAAQGLDNVIIPGWIDSPKLWTLMRLSRIGLLPYLPSKDFLLSIPNKAVEYLSAGLPIVTSLSGGYLAQLLAAHECGFMYRGKDPGSLASALMNAALQCSPRMNDAAKQLFDERFHPLSVKSAMIKHITSLAAKAPGGGNPS